MNIAPACNKHIVLDVCRDKDLERDPKCAKDRTQWLKVASVTSVTGSHSEFIALPGFAKLNQVHSASIMTNTIFQPHVLRPCAEWARPASSASAFLIFIGLGLCVLVRPDELGWHA